MFWNNDKEKRIKALEKRLAQVNDWSDGLSSQLQSELMRSRELQAELNKVKRNAVELAQTQGVAMANSYGFRVELVCDEYEFALLRNVADSHRAITSDHITNAYHSGFGVFLFASESDSERFITNAKFLRHNGGDQS